MKTSLVLAGIRWNYAKINQITPHLILHNSWKFVMIIDSQSSPTSRHTLKSQFTGKSFRNCEEFIYIDGSIKDSFCNFSLFIFSSGFIWLFCTHIPTFTPKFGKHFSIQKAQKPSFLCPFFQVYKRNMCGERDNV